MQMKYIIKDEMFDIDTKKEMTYHSKYKRISYSVFFSYIKFTLNLS